MPLVTNKSRSLPATEKFSRGMTALRSELSTVQEFRNLFWSDAKHNAAGDAGVMELFITTVQQVTTLRLGSYVPGQHITGFQAEYLLAALQTVLESNQSALKTRLDKVRLDQLTVSRMAYEGSLVPRDSGAELNLYLVTVANFLYTSNAQTCLSVRFDGEVRRPGESFKAYLTRLEFLGAQAGIQPETLTERLLSRVKDASWKFLSPPGAKVPQEIKDLYERYC